jgi:hypothetical protein
MSEYRLSGLFWSVGLAASGVLILLFNFDLLSEERLLLRYVVAGIFAAGGLVFLVSFFVARRHWWRLIPAWTLLALAAMVGLSTLDTVAPTVTAALLFAGLAISFAHVYLLNRALHWWALIPGGFLFVVGAVIALNDVLPLTFLGVLLFSGMGLVFCLIYVLGDRRQQRWALIPGAVLLIFGLFVLAGGGDQGNSVVRWWPLLLVAVGLWIGWQEARRGARWAQGRGPFGRGSEKLTIHVAPVALRQAIPPVSRTEPSRAERSALGDYSKPAPGASVEVLPEEDA